MAHHKVHRFFNPGKIPPGIIGNNEYLNRIKMLPYRAGREKKIL
jgi:hypothetical protein